MLLQPVLVREAPGGVLLHGPVVQQLPGLQIHRHHLARTEAPLLDHGLAAEIHNAGFRSHDHEPIRGGAPTGRSQSIAIQGGAHPLAVGEHQQGGAVPGLLDAGIEFVHRRHLRTAVEIGLVAEGLRHQRDQAVGDRAAAAHHQLKRGVEIGRVAEARVDHRIEVSRCISPDLRKAGF